MHYGQPRTKQRQHTGQSNDLNTTVKKKRWRPTANVRFTHAVALIHGLSKSIVLVDRTGRYLDVLTESD